jgi:hypothetical protein
MAGLTDDDIGFEFEAYHMPNDSMEKGLLRTRLLIADLYPKLSKLYDQYGDHHFDD